MKNYISFASYPKAINFSHLLLVHSKCELNLQPKRMWMCRNWIERGKKKNCEWGQHDETENRFPFSLDLPSALSSLLLSVRLSVVSEPALRVRYVLRQRSHNDFNSPTSTIFFFSPHRSFYALCTLHTVHIEVLVLVFLCAISFRSNYVEWALWALEQCKGKKINQEKLNG